MKTRNTHTGKIQEYSLPTNEERAVVYFNAAYERIFLGGFETGCVALSMAAKDQLYQAFTLLRGSRLVAKYKKVYSELYPEFMLFKRDGHLYWFDNKEERIWAFLFCAEMAKSSIS